MTCPECSSEVSSQAATCPKCGVSIKAKSSIWKWVLGVPVGLFVILFIFGSLNSTPQRASTRNALELCMEQMNDPNIDAESKRLVIKPTCDKFRSELR